VSDYDAIVIGAGHNGLTAAFVMARGGMRVLCLEKNHFMFWVFGPEDLDAQRRAREAFDPQATMNPGKIFPGGDACADIPTERTKRALAEGMWV